jgi:hypothetical protein
MNYLQTLALLADNPFTKILKPVTDILDAALVPLIGVVGGLGALYCVFLGLKLAKAEEPQDRDKAKNALKNAILGFVIIFVLLVVLKIALPALQDWATSSGAGNLTTTAQN